MGGWIRGDMDIYLGIANHPEAGLDGPDTRLAAGQEDLEDVVGFQASTSTHSSSHSSSSSSSFPLHLFLEGVDELLDGGTV